MTIHADKLRWLLWLRWKTLTRGFSRRPASLVGAVVLLLVVLWIGGSIGGATFFSYRNLTPPANSEGLYLVLAGGLLVWLLLPLLAFTVNECLDVSKLT